MLIDAARSCLLVVDVQERLAPAVLHPGGVVGRVKTLVQAARRLQVPTLVSEQYPKGLGRTLPELAPLLGSATLVEKLHFSCAEEPAYLRALETMDRDLPVVCGMEAHVCVLQTALGLAEAGYHVAVVADAVGSRRERDHDAAIDRMRAEGLTIVTTEMVVFEWLGQAGTAAFKELSALIK